MLETRALKSRSRSRQLLVSVASEENRMKLSPPSLSSSFLRFCPSDGFGGWRGMADREPLPPFRPPKIGDQTTTQDNFKHATIRSFLAH